MASLVRGQIHGTRKVFYTEMKKCRPLDKIGNFDKMFGTSNLFGPITFVKNRFLLRKMYFNKMMHLGCVFEIHAQYVYWILLKLPNGYYELESRFNNRASNVKIKLLVHRASVSYYSTGS